MTRRIQCEHSGKASKIPCNADRPPRHSQTQSSIRSKPLSGSIPQPPASGKQYQTLRQPASEGALPSTIPDSFQGKMLVNGSQSDGDTQPISPSIYEQYNTRSKEQRAARTSRPSESSLEGQQSIPHTLQQGEPGHVDLLAAFEQPSLCRDNVLPAGEYDDDDTDPLSQPQDVRAELFPESRRFQPPRTPASQGRKRKREVETSPQRQSTPRLPVNPFAGQVGNMEGIMGASQLFQATQAVTSPLTNLIASDSLSERPSPDMHSLQRPATAGSLSSPVRPPRSNIVRAVTEPQGEYISMQQSQEKRERLLQERKAEQALYSNELSDDDFDDDPQLRRRLRQQRFNVEARKQFAEVAARSDVVMRGQGRSRAVGTTNTPGKLSPLRLGKRAGEPVIISDDGPMDDGRGTITEEETEREDEVEAREDDDVDELAEDNKENVEVPGTISRGPSGRSQVISSQPTPSHGRVPRVRVGSPDKAVQVFGSSQISRSQETPILAEAGTQPDAIADSQSSQSNLYIKPCSRRPGTRAFSEPRSSLDSRVVAPHSQSSEGIKTFHPSIAEDGRRMDFQDPSSSLPQVSSVAENPSPGNADHHMESKVPSSAATVQKPEVTSPTKGAQEIKNTPGPQSRNAQLTNLSAVDQLTRKGTTQDSNDVVESSRIEGTVPNSSTIMPSARTTPKSSSKVGFTNSATDASRASTLFQTAPEHTSNSSARLSPLRGPRRSQSTHSSPEMSRRLRSMSEIAANPSPPDAIGEIDIDVGIFTNEDREFQKVVHGSSPIAHSRKRLRESRGSLQNVQIATITLPPVPGSPLPPPSSAVSKITPVKTVSSKSTPPSSPPPCHSTSPSTIKPIRHLEKQHYPDPKGGYEAMQQQSMGEKESSKQALPASNAPSIPRGRIPDSVGEKPSTSRASEGATKGHEAVVRDSPVIAPNRVFAHFNGTNSGYYPATCLGVSGTGELRYSVRFDDGTVDTISGYSIKRLELRVGDVIKVDLPGARTKNYIVEGMRDQRQPATRPDPETPSRRGRQHSTNDAAFPETDCHGFATVLASPKQRVSVDGTQIDSSQIAIPLTQIYLTLTLWTSFKNRQYTHVPTRVQTLTGLQTPSDRPSTPSTPSSRTRRIKMSGLVQSYPTTASTRTSEGLFHNMAFAITNVDRSEDSKRVKERVRCNGGIILENGFDELFNVPTLNRTATSDRNSRATLHLTSEAQDLGFTCLIADKHCRRAKFIQALALGIPCLATRWVSDCVAKQRIVPWAPYLLPSGESAFLSGAIRSRNLQPFSADKASLAKIVENRTKLLDGASVLLIMEKNQEETMRQHPLITHALGASRVVKAVNVDAAMKELADAQALNEDWDWVFSYDKEKDTEKRLFGTANPGRKRKRGKENEMHEGPMKKVKTKVVGNEFVIQSLILGMLIDE